VSIGPKTCSLPWLALSCAALSWGLSSMPSAVQTRSALAPEALAPGEAWRLWTGHLVHFGPAHLRGDLLAFLVWAALLERESRRALARILFIGAPLLSLAILLCCPSLDQYRGLSGLDCSLVVALIWRRGLASQRLRGVGVLCLAAFAAKCAYELIVGKALFASDLGAGVKLLPLAHVLGAALGLMLGAVSPRSRPHATSNRGRHLLGGVDRQGQSHRIRQRLQDSVDVLDAPALVGGAAAQRQYFDSRRERDDLQRSQPAGRSRLVA
jgi:rhomboid family GlyGly-CTERM serine protease